MKAKRCFTVRPRLPEELGPLAGLATNLRWSWDRRTQSLFEQIDPGLWEETRHDPQKLLASVDPSRLDRLSRDADYVTRLTAAASDLEAHGEEPRWFERRVDDDNWPTAGRIAYFSPEFGISEAILQYSGGLGVLAGDHVKAASDLGLPLVAIGLFYRHGYFRQELSVDGWQHERFADVDPHALALEQCDDVKVELDLAGRPAVLQVWRAMVGRVPLYLLDADVAGNDPEVQMVTDRLYGGDVEHRLRQEILLGIGGVRALRALGEPATVFHTNEGHAGFLGLERIRTLVGEEGLSLAEAFEAVRAGSVFTTHTPVPAGIDRFPRELIEKYFAGWAEECGVTMDELMRLGRSQGPQSEDRFNMAVMGMRLARRRNGVSELHGEVSRSMFGELWPGVPPAEVPVTHITNGVHAATWTSPEFSELYESTLGPDWQWDPASWESATELRDDELTAARTSARTRLVQKVRTTMRNRALAAGRSPSELGWVDEALDPNVLTIGFARRMATHKRAGLLLTQPDRLRALLARTDSPVQFVFAGKAHPHDDEGKEMIRRLVAFAHEPELRSRFVFVEDYDMGVARAMVQGCDVWLNTPLRPLEASGTSGMKAVLNGALHCSVLDGWWSEAFSPGTGSGSGLPNGWAVSSALAVDDDRRRSELEADSLFELLENQIVPLFTAHDAGGFRHEWLDRMRESLRTLGPMVGAHRMVRDYVEEMYLPAARHARSMSESGFRGARQLAAFRREVATAWPGVRVESVDAEEGVADLGESRAVRAVVSLGGLEPSQVEVQLVVGHVAQTGEIENPKLVTMACEGPLRGTASGAAGADHQDRFAYSGSVPLALAGRMGVTVRVLPHHDLLATPVEFGRIAWAD